MLQPTSTRKSEQLEGRKTDIRQYLWVILRHKWIILMALLVTVASTSFYLRRATPMYKTSAKILIEEQKGELLLFKELDFLGQLGLAEELETYCELLRTHKLVREVVENLGLHEAMEERENGSNSFLNKLVQFVHLANGGRPEESEELQIRRATEELQEMVNVGPLGDTRIVKITVSGPDPDLATNIANEIASVFISYNLQSMKSEARSAYDFISEQSKQVQSKLRTTEDNLRRFKEEEGVVELTEEAKITLEKLSAVETNYNTTIVQRQEAEARRDATREELGNQAEIITSSTTIVENPLVQQLKGQLYNFEAELAGLLKIYPENTPEVEQINTKITQTKEKLAKEVERIVTNETSSINPVHQSLVSRLIQLEADVIAYGVMGEAQKTFVEQYRTELDRLPSKELQLARLARDKNVSDRTYMMLMQRKEEAQLAQAIQVGNISIADPAIRPIRPYSPRKKASLMLGVVVGLALGLGFAFFLEFIDNTFRTEGDVERYLELPLLGSVPMLKPQARSTKNPVRLSQQESRMLTHFSPRMPEAEAYRMLNTNVQFGEVDEPVQTLLVTSATPGEGKTITAANFAITMAQSGAETLLVDTDMRKPMIHRLFRLERQPGLTDFFLGEAGIQDIVRNSQIDNLSVITSGDTPPNSPQLLSSQKMKELIGELKEQFDMVVFDSPPAAVVTDPAILGSRLDAVCLVVEAENTSRDTALKAKEILTNVGANVLGVVLNKVDVRKAYGSYYYRYYYYYYDDDHGDGHRGKKQRKR